MTSSLGVRAKRPHASVKVTTTPSVASITMQLDDVIYDDTDDDIYDSASSGAGIVIPNQTTRWPSSDHVIGRTAGHSNRSMIDITITSISYTKTTTDMHRQITMKPSSAAILIRGQSFTDVEHQRHVMPVTSSTIDTFQKKVTSSVRGKTVLRVLIFLTPFILIVLFNVRISILDH